MQWNDPYNLTHGSGNEFHYKTKSPGYGSKLFDIINYFQAVASEHFAADTERNPESVC